MADETKIQWCDSTVNPIMGCCGCELFPKKTKVIAAIDEALADSGTDLKSASLLRPIIQSAYDAIPEPGVGHKRALSTTNIWHAKELFLAEIRKVAGNASAQAAETAIKQAITCYAAKLHLNKAFSIINPGRAEKGGYAPTFEQITPFADRVRKAADLKDLRGKHDPDRPWIDHLPRLIFVSDMGDAFSRKTDFDFLRRDVIAAIDSERGRQHLWLWLTKQPERMADFAAEISGFPDNVCVMTTVTGPDTLHRVAALQKVQAQIKGLSIEPQWERIAPSKLRLTDIDWVIQGGESGSKKFVRPFDLAWAEEIRDHCAKRGVAYFLKQLGRNPLRNGQPVRLRNSHGGDWDEEGWDADLRVREFPQAFHDYRAAEGDAPAGMRRTRKGNMTPGEAKDFKRLDKIVSKAAKTFVKAAAALYEIRERRLYRARHKTFEAYCQSVHQISRQYANKLIKAGRVRIEMEPIVSNTGLPMPDNEGQLRELARVSDPQQRKEVLEAAVQVVGNGNGNGNGTKLTAAILREQVDKQLQDGKAPSQRRQSPAQKLVKAREKLTELRKAYESGEDITAMLRSLMRMLKC